MAEPGFAGGFARGLQRSFPNIGDRAIRQREREEDRALKDREHADKEFKAKAETQYKQNVQAADKILDHVKTEIENGTIEYGDEEYQYFEKLYQSYYQNASLRGATLGIGAPPMHGPEIFRRSTSNIKTKSQQREEDITNEIEKRKRLLPGRLEEIEAETKTREEVKKKFKTDEEITSGVPTTVSNSIRAISYKMFGGDIDPLTGEPIALSGEELVSALRLAKEAERLWKLDRTQGTNEVVFSAYQGIVGQPAQEVNPLAQGAISGAPPQAALGSGSEVTVQSLMQQQPNLTREAAESIIRRSQNPETQQSVPEKKSGGLYSSKLGRQITQQDLDDTIDGVIEQAKKNGREMSRADAMNIVMKQLGIQ